MKLKKTPKPLIGKIKLTIGLKIKSSAKKFNIV